MNCRSCGTPLPQGILYCPSCRKPTPYLTAGRGRPSMPTQASSTGSAYGSQRTPYGAQQNAYGPPSTSPQEPFPEPASPGQYDAFSSPSRGGMAGPFQGGNPTGLDNTVANNPQGMTYGSRTPSSTDGFSHNQASFPPYRPASNQSTYGSGYNPSTRDDRRPQGDPLGRPSIPTQASGYNSQRDPSARDDLPPLGDPLGRPSIPTVAMPSSSAPFSGNNHPSFSAPARPQNKPSFPGQSDAFSLKGDNASFAPGNTSSFFGDAADPMRRGDPTGSGNMMTGDKQSSPGQFGQENNASPFSTYRSNDNPSSFSAYRFSGPAMPAMPDSGTAGNPATTSSFGMMGSAAPVTPFGEVNNSSFSTSFGTGANANSSLTSQFSMAANAAAATQLDPAGAMAAQQSPFALPATSTSQSPGFIQSDTRPRTDKAPSRLKGWLIVGSIAIVLVLLVGAGGIALVNTFKNTTTTAGTTPTTPVVATPKPRALSTTVPSIQAIVPQAAAMLNGLQTASAIDPTTFLPTQVTTAFTTNQTIYATFFINSKNQAGYIQVQWYENNQVLAVDKFSHDPQDNVGYFNQQYSAAGDGAVALYLCTKADCSDGKLAQVAKFNVSGASGTPTTNPFATPTSLQDMDRRIA